MVDGGLLLTSCCPSLYGEGLLPCELICGGGLIQTVDSCRSELSESNMELHRTSDEAGGQVVLALLIETA